MVYDFHVYTSPFGVHGYQVHFDVFEKIHQGRECCNQYID